ncbi:MAG: VIT1/CCC1 transporter family protein [Candidatus Helarchaeota archaeon]
MEAFRKLKYYIKISETGPLLRRFFVMNAFDGSLTTLGILIGAWTANGGFFGILRYPSSFFFDMLTIQFIVSVGLATAFSMGVSGIWGSYMASEAERMVEKDHIERAMILRKGEFDHSVMDRAQKVGSMMCALVDGGSPALAAILCLIPFFLALVFPLNNVAFILSICVTFVLLIILGAFLGKISQKRLIISAIKMVIAGLVITAIFVVLNIFFPS